MTKKDLENFRIKWSIKGNVKWNILKNLNLKS